MLTYLTDTLTNFKLIDFVDILLVAILLYQFYNLLKGTGAINIFLGIIAFYFVYKIVRALHMELLGEILGAFISVGFIALIVVFQPEIRRFLLMLGTPNFMTKKHKRFLFWRLRLSNPIQVDISAIVKACERMASQKTGALIVLSRQHKLTSYAHSGELIDALVSQQLLENIFFKNSPLHDGAVIIHENRIQAARCVLPVSETAGLPEGLGLRHRAAVGITEQSDAVALIVSEQTGNIAVAEGGTLAERLSTVQLYELLEAWFSQSA